jgi:hypothetical protein
MRVRERGEVLTTVAVDRACCMLGEDGRTLFIAAGITEHRLFP